MHGLLTDILAQKSNNDNKKNMDKRLSCFMLFLFLLLFHNFSEKQYERQIFFFLAQRLK